MITRRGVFLILFGLLYGLVGYSYLVPLEPLAEAVVHSSLRIILQWRSLHFYGWCWLIFGAVTVIGGLFRRLDWLGFAAAEVMPTAWAIVYLAAWVDGDNSRGWVTAVLFALIAAAVGTVAGMPDEPPPPDVPADVPARR